MGNETDMSQRNITDADRACPNNLVSQRDKPTGGPLKPLTEGQIIGKRWKVVQQIEPELGFNNIYVVQHDKKQQHAAMKIEQKGSANPMLKFELFVLLHMEQKKQTKKFCKVFDRGATDDFNWMVISLRGKNLRTIRKETENGKLTMACGLSVGVQCLQALEELHKLGFIHRSVNPSDFAIGLYTPDGDTKELRTVYLLDFAFARQYREADGKHKPPRPQPWKYVGSSRHAPRNAFLGQELSRLDDVEMWFYMVVELIKGSLPWVAYREPKQIFDYQKLVRTGLPQREFLGGLPVELVGIMKEVDRLGYKDEPNYKEIYTLLTTAIQACETKEFPYDWEEAEIAAAKAEKEKPKEGEKGAEAAKAEEKK